MTPRAQGPRATLAAALRQAATAGVRRVPPWAWLVLLAAALGLYARLAWANTYTVTTTADTAGSTCAGTCSLRQAINAANAAGGGPHTILFNITGTGVHTITPTTALPTITRAVILNATTDDSFAANGNRPAIVLDGNNLAASGLVLGPTADGSTIRGLVIRDFGGHGIQVQAGSDGHTIAGNYIGSLLPTGLSAGADEVNTGSGIHLSGANNTVGGTGTRDGNVLSGNNVDGVTGGASSGNLLQANVIGLTADAGAALANGSNGVWFGGGSTNNTIGGTGSAANVIGGNFYAGVLLEGAGNTGNVVRGNWIGLNTLSVGIGNAVGVVVKGGAAGNTIGGTGGTDGNTIAFNTDYGIVIFEPATTGNAVLGNSIRSHPSLGIDLGYEGVTANDTGDADTGPNNLQNFPVLATARTNASNQLILTGSLNSTASSFYRIEFFSNTVQDSSGYGEGQTYLGFANVPTNGSGNGTISTTLSVTVPVGSFISATATKSNAGYSAFTDTSEFSRNVAAVSSTQATIAVDTTADTSDGDTTSLSTLLANKGADGFVSLREAITAANNTANGTGPDRITFAIAGSGVRTINVAAAGLPSITQAVVIDATTQSGWAAGAPIVELNGGNLGSGVEGLTLAAGSDGSSVSGLIINRFTGSGIEIIGSSSQTIQGNRIGLNAAGTAASANAVYGIFATNSAGHLIGGTTAAQRNVVSGNASYGIRFDNADNSTIAGNYIGTDAAGTGDVNGTVADTVRSGVYLNAGSSGNVVGGTTAGARNVISGNNHYGVEILTAASQNNVVQGNYIGTDATGSVALGNSNGGMSFWGAGTGNVLGGGAGGAGNVIAGNLGHGVSVGNAASGATIQGNLIGLAANGTVGIGNASGGIRVQDASVNTLIGTDGDGSNDSNERNVVSGNGGIGILVRGAGTNGTQIKGNRIGTNAAGSAAVANTGNGVQVDAGAASVTIGTDLSGGNDAGEGNVIAGNTANGIQLWDAGTGVAIRGNLIGVNAGATAALGNGTQGIQVGGTTTGFTVGGTVTLAANTIGGNASAGVELNGSGVTGNVVQGNFIGTDATASRDLRNLNVGVIVFNGAANNAIGGTATGAGNTVFFNQGAGILVKDSASVGNALLGNRLQGNAAVGIDLGSYDNVTLNDLGDADVGPNNLQNFPVLAAANTNASTQIVINGTLNSTASSYFRIEFFANTSQDASGHGEGQTYLGSANVATDASGNATIGTTLTANVPVGSFISATATKSNAGYSAFTDTSEFSRNVAAVSSTQATIAVDTTSDTSDGDTTSLSTLLANKGADGMISLREAITAANKTINGTSPDRIVFAIAGTGVHTIVPLTALPTIVGSVVLDATTDDSFAANGSRPAIVLDGNGLIADGLRLGATADGTTVRGFVIRNFGQHGIAVLAGADGNTIVGNYMGSFNASGTNAGAGEQNTGAGIYIAGSGNIVGGVAVADRNLIGGNNDGIELSGGATGNIVRGNHIGTDITGTLDVGNRFDGVWIVGANSNQILDNLISGNDFRGINVGDSGNSTGNVIQGNRIGTSADGTTGLANSQHGILLGNGGTVSNTLIGGAAVGQGNTIAFNGLDGISIASGTAVSMLANSIHSNNETGVDLGNNGVTANDAGDADTGANNLQNFPVLAAANTNASTQIVINGTLNSTASSYFRVEFFANTSQDPTGYGEGRTYLGFANVPTNGSGNGTFSTTLSVNVPLGSFISATATKSDSAYTTFTDTSEFAANVVAGQAVSGTVFEDMNYGGGPGRSLGVSGGAGRGGATVELYNSSGVFVSSTTTAADGSYSLSAGANGTFYVRVVGSTVTSSRSGAVGTLRAVQTYRTTAASGTAVAVADQVGGLNPALVDPGAGSAGATLNTTTFVFSAGLSGTAQSVAPVVTGGSGVAGVDFGFNFDTVVNVNDSGTGSLRQAITNANALAGDAVLAQTGRAAGVENLVFMISNGSTGAGGSLGLAAGGLRASLNYFSGGAATIVPSIALPIISASLVVNAQAQPGWAGNPVVVVDGNNLPATGLTLGGTADGSTIRGLVIRDFGQSGIRIDAGADGNTIAGNYLGSLNANGTTAGAGEANAGHGVEILGSNNTVGGTAAADRNVVSGNVGHGIFVNGSGAAANTVVGNHVGTDASGSAALANSEEGIHVLDAPTAQIGGTAAGARNVLSGNVKSGLWISGGSNITIQGNYVGVNAAGTAALANGNDGVAFNAVVNVTVGGTAAGAGNVISGNGKAGVNVFDYLGTSTGVQIQGNHIGTNAAGTAAVPNGQQGIYGSGTGTMTVGGTAAGAGNLISGNSGATANGVLITGGTSTVQGNTIGLSSTGAPLPNGTAGSSTAGITIAGGSGHVIGGASAAARNVVAGNGGAGIRMTGGSATIQGNHIGVKSDGSTAAGNGNHGLYVNGATATVGGSAAGAGNVIAHNTGSGVNFASGSAAVTLSRNSIYGNTGIGIDLADNGVSANDGAKTTGQPNQLMDHPAFTSARARGNQLTVAGYVGSAAGQAAFANAQVEIFDSDQDGSGFGEGRTYLGSITADASGNFSGTVTMAVAALRIGTRLTATATDAGGNTSEFGANFAGLVVDLVVNDNGDAIDAGAGDGYCLTAGGVCTLRAAIAEVNAAAAQATPPTITFALPGCTTGLQAACTITPATNLPVLARAMTLDATTQPGFTAWPVVGLVGSANASGTPTALEIGAAGGGSTLRGLRFAGWSSAAAYAVRLNGSAGNAVEGNWFGLDASGVPTAAATNRNAVTVGNATAADRIGGVVTGQRNVIANSSSSGVYTFGGASPTIQANWFGLNGDGSASVQAANDVGILASSAGVVIGGTVSRSGNRFGRSTTANVRVDTNGGAVPGASATVQGNVFGLDANGAAAPSAGEQIFIAAGVGATTIGGTAAGAGNVVTGAATRGIGIAAGSGTRATITGNAVYGNGGLGIDLGRDGVSANDGAFDAAQANGGIDFPVVTAAGVGDAGNSLTVAGYVGTGSGQAAFAGARIELFKSDRDASGYGEGSVYLGFLTADANGRFSGTVAFGAGLLAVGDAVTATATDAAGNSSEFGPWRNTTTMAALSPASFNAFDTDAAGSALAGVLRSRVAGSATNVAVVALDSGGTGLHTGFTGTVALAWLDARDDSGAASGSCRASWVDLGSAGSAAFSNQNRVTAAVTPPATATRAMRLKMTYAGPSGTVTACSNDAFAALPAQLAWGDGGGGAGGHGASDATSAAAGVARRLDTVTATAGAAHQAGRPFTLQARALDAVGALMTGYDGTPTVTLAACLLPSGCSAGTLTAPAGAAVAGRWRSDSAAYAEVGAFRLAIADAGYGAVDAGDTAPAARTVVGGTLDVGRFVPDTYTAAVSTSARFATANAACLAAGSGATFLGQGFGWSTVPQVTVTARNAAGQALALWTGSLMRLNPASGMTTTVTVAGAGSAALAASYGAVTLTPLGAGQVRLTAGALDRFVLDVAAGAFQPSVTPTWQWQLAFVDTSEAGVTGNPQPGAAAVQAAVPFDAGGAFHSGRVQLGAAHGDARRGVRMLLALQRYTAAGWVTMTEDRGCVAVDRSRLAVELPSGVFAGAAGVCAAPLAAAATTAGGRAWLTLPATPAAAAGRLAMRLPGSSSIGSANACSPAGAPQAAAASPWPWLLGAAGPVALATWGSPDREPLLRREIW